MTIIHIIYKKNIKHVDKVDVSQTTTKHKTGILKF